MTDNIQHDICQNEHERGFALILVLVIIMTLTVLGIGVMTSSSTNSALSRNFEKNTQAVNITETGIKVAYREFINSGFLQKTHTLGKEYSQSGDSLLTTSLDNYYIDTNGDFVWEWDSSKGYDPMWDTDKPHGFRFRVYYTSDFSFAIESEGWFDKIRKRSRARGEIEDMFQFSYFASRDLGEFVRGADQTISGKVHANGNLLIKPSGSTLRINSSSVSATGFIIRSRDVWGRPDEDPPGGQCLITKDSEGSGDWVEMEPGSPRGSEGIAFDSFHPDWTDKNLGVRALWGGVVRDKVPYKSPPPTQNLDLGGYYDNEAGLHISPGSDSEPWCHPETFFNWNEQRMVTVREIDFASMISNGASRDVIGSDNVTRIIKISGNHAAEFTAGDAISIVSCTLPAGLNGNYTVQNATDNGSDTDIEVNEAVASGASDGVLYMESAVNDWPANGLIYCTLPVRLKNASKLKDKLTLTSKSNVYILGDFNTIDKKGASIMTKHRIYILSGNWDDALSSNPVGDRQAISTRINAALVDGSPPVDEYNWADRDNDNRYDWSSITRYSPESPKTAAGFNDPNSSSDPWANCDDLLEDWAGITLTKYGSVINLGGADMCPNLDNSGLQSDELAWVQKTGYRAPNRDYGFDPDLATPGGQPPFTPLIGHITSWAPY